MSDSFSNAQTRQMDSLEREVESRMQKRLGYFKEKDIEELDKGQDASKRDNVYQEVHTENMDLIPVDNTTEEAKNIMEELKEIIQGVTKNKSMQYLKSAAARLKRLAEMGDVKETTTCAVKCGEAILMGKRKDTGLYTFPGGGMKAGEDPAIGAARELYEETGIRGADLKHLKTEEVAGRTGRKVIVHCYECSFDTLPKTSVHLDPDNEIESWVWVPVKEGLPEEFATKLHTPKNLLLKCLGLQK